MRSSFGVLVVDKPAGPTSHDVVDWIRWTTRQRAVGHCGTLDPAATGVLVVCLGAATRLAKYLSAADKRYRATFVLGRSTTTADADGDTLDEAPVDASTARRIQSELRGMVHEDPLELPPPAFSAVKVDGKRAHAMARAGQVPQLVPRPMRLHAVDALTCEPPGRRGAEPESAAWMLSGDLWVAKGTYVRSIAEALGQRCHVPVHLGALRRTASGGLGLDGALGPLTAHLLDPGPHGGTRWRIRPAHGAGDREAGASAVAAHLLDPLAALPFSRLDHAVDARVGPLVVRLAQGQRLGLRDPEVRALVEPALRADSSGARGAVSGPVPDFDADGGPDGDGPARHLTFVGAQGEFGERVCVVARVEHVEDRGWRVAPATVVRDPGRRPKGPKLLGDA